VCVAKKRIAFDSALFGAVRHLAARRPTRASLPDGLHKQHGVCPPWNTEEYKMRSSLFMNAEIVALIGGDNFSFEHKPLMLFLTES